MIKAGDPVDFRSFKEQFAYLYGDEDWPKNQCYRENGKIARKRPKSRACG